VKALVAVPSRQPREEIRTLFAYHRSVVETTARRFRLLLYLASILLLVMLAYLGLRLRARALAIRRLAAFEHVIAENSTRLINCPPAETDARLKQVLGELGWAIGAERAYVVLDEIPTRVHAWSRDGRAFPPGWPNQALALSAQLGTAGPDIATVPDVAALPPGAVKDTLTAAGVRAWARVPLVRPGRVQGIMGFDAFYPIRKRVLPLPVVRLAGDAVANAIEREFLERDRARLTTRLERARRMQMIGSLASGIAHNFNNIIGAILGYSEMVEPQLAPGTKPAQACRRDTTGRGAWARSGRQHPHVRAAARRACQVGAGAHPVRGGGLAAARFAALPGIELIIGDVPADVAISGEPAQLQQVILNLCTNAAQAMEDRDASA
jgi:hypothetical protein